MKIFFTTWHRPHELLTATNGHPKPHHQNIFLCVHKLMDDLEDLETPVIVHAMLS